MVERGGEKIIRIAKKLLFFNIIAFLSFEFMKEVNKANVYGNNKNSYY